MFKILFAIAVLVIALTLVACGGGGDETVDTGSPEVDTAAETTVTSDIHYRTEHDPAVVYTPENVTLEGSYLKENLDDLTPDQFNRVMHRLRTERSTCGSGLLIDECLINRPGCWVSVTLYEQVVREEKLKG